MDLSQEPWLWGQERPGKESVPWKQTQDRPRGWNVPDWLKPLTGVDLGRSNLNRWKPRWGSQKFVWWGRRGQSCGRKSSWDFLSHLFRKQWLWIGTEARTSADAVSQFDHINAFFSDGILSFSSTLLKKVLPSGDGVNSRCCGNKWLYFMTKFTSLADLSSNFLFLNALKFCFMWIYWSWQELEVN